MKHRAMVIAVAAFALAIIPARIRAQTRTMPDSVRSYILDAMREFRTRSVHRNEVDWNALQDSVMARAAAAQTTDATWAALTWALRRVDPHSFIMPSPAKMRQLTGGMTQSASAPQQAAQTAAPFHDARIGMLVVRGHSGLNRTSYVDSLHEQIRAFDKAGVCGWIIDLRENTGGNMWPMLAGIGPLLGDELVGSFTVNAPGTGWRYRNGQSWEGDAAMPATVTGWGSGAAPTLTHPDAPVAVLIGRKTASSGEMTLLSFLGRPNTRSFGDSTAGFTSSNSTVTLRDSAQMIVTSSYPRDRLGRAYPLRVAPDEQIVPTDGDGRQAVERRAAEWLYKQPACSR